MARDAGACSIEIAALLLIGDLSVMDHFYLTEYFDWKIRRNSYVDRILNWRLDQS